MTNIRPSSDLRNKYNEISEFCHKYDEPVYIGLPLVILAKDDEVRISTDEESLEYLDYQLKKSGYTDDEEEMLPDDTLTVKSEH